MASASDAVGEGEHRIGGAVHHQCGKTFEPAQPRIGRTVLIEDEVVGHACGDVVGAVEHPTGDGAQAGLVEVSRAGVGALAFDVPGAQLIELQNIGHQLPPPHTWERLIGTLIEHTATA